MENENISGVRKHRWAWMWLAYTAFLLIQPIVEPKPYLWLGTIASLAVFFVIFYVFFYGTSPSQPKSMMVIAAIFFLGMVTFPWNQGASTYFIYAAAFLPFTIESIPRIVWLILGECGAIAAEGLVFSAPGNFHVGWGNVLFACFLVIVIGGGNIYFAEQRRADCKLRAALEENVTLAAVAERERIARDLHDVLGHTLSVIVLKAELAGRLISIDSARAQAEMADVEKTARAALSEIREAIGGYRARGLAAEIEAARLTLDAAGVQLIVEGAPAGAAPLTPQEETALALVLREAVTNIVRHARATTCHLCFVREAGNRKLVVEDNGEHIAIREGNGVRGMRERIEALGGRFALERGNQAHHGTRLTIDLPLTRATAS